MRTLSVATLVFGFGLVGGRAGATPQLAITEYAYNLAAGEFIELTNVGATPLSLTGWSIDDVEGIPGAYSLSAGGVLAPGASIVVTTEPVGAFRAAWGLSQGVVLGDNDTAKLSRTDTIHVFNPLGVLVDRLAFGDEVFEYTVRTNAVTAYVCPEALGADDPYGWRMSIPGDAQGSWVSTAGDVGSPLRFVQGPCVPLPIGTPYCSAAPNSGGFSASLIGAGNPTVAVGAFTLRAERLPASSVGYAIASQAPTFIAHPGGSAGHLCLGGTIRRLVTTARPASALGEWSAPLDLAGLGVGALQTWYFQVWYRDADPLPTSNFSAGVSVRFR